MWLVLVLFFGTVYNLGIGQTKKNEERGIAASFSAFGLILLSRRQKQKQAQKVCAVMSFLLFTLNFK